ncbi:MAG TPA: NAD-dependent deacylase [Solirubrobacterales bacterium]|nr:NAD-dependent deacylase [Solirubrobacterales bacterium]
MSDSSLVRAAELIAGARRGVAFTGAGISAESGIPTFRGEGGLWRRYDPFKVSSIESFMADPSSYWSVARERGRESLAASPNPAHRALVSLEAAGHVSAVVTQNTDGLHRDAGSTTVLELHGSGRRVRCLDCGFEEQRAGVQARLEQEMPPRCRGCGGIHIKPTVVFFGEAMPAATTAAAFDLARHCDLMLVVGSSLVVYPAAGVPETAAAAGAPLVIVNAEPTPQDDSAEVVLLGRAGEVLPRLAELVSARV